MRFAFVITLLASLGCAGALEQEPAPLQVFAAVSLRDVVTELSLSFRRAGHAGAVEHNFAGSNVLAQQILASGQGDLFISADEAWVDHVRALGGNSGEKFALIESELVVVANARSSLALSSLAGLAALDMRVLSIGDPESVPVGRYAKRALERAGVYEAVRDKVSPAPDARAALAVVENVPGAVGLVYATDAARSARVRVLARTGEQGRYFATTLGAHPAREAYARFLRSPAALAIFAKHGFTPAS